MYINQSHGLHEYIPFFSLLSNRVFNLYLGFAQLWFHTREKKNSTHMQYDTIIIISFNILYLYKNSEHIFSRLFIVQLH